MTPSILREFQTRRCCSCQEEFMASHGRACPDCGSRNTRNVAPREVRSGAFTWRMERQTTPAEVSA